MKKNTIVKDPRIRKLRMKGKVRGDVLGDVRMNLVKKQVVEGLSKKQKKKWERLSPKEQQKLLATVEKRVKKKMRKDPSIRKRLSVKKDRMAGNYKRVASRKRKQAGVGATGQERTARNTVYNTQRKLRNGQIITRKNAHKQNTKQAGQNAKEQFLKQQSRSGNETKPVSAENQAKYQKSALTGSERSGKTGGIRSYKQRYNKELKKIRKVSAKEARAF